MAFLSQTMNTFAQTPILGLVDLIPSPNVIAAQLNPSSAAVFQVGTALKLLAANDSGLPVVDACTGPTDGPVFGVIPYGARKNLYVAGDIVSVALDETYIFLRSSAAIARGDKVTTTAATTTTDPLVTTVSVPSTQYVTGVAIDIASAANVLLRIRIKPSFNGTV